MNGLLVHGVNEKNNEDMGRAIISIMENDMVEEITIHDIDRTHHLGKRKLDNNVSWPIIFKFTRYKNCSSIFKTRKKLVNITENLTKKRVTELKKREK